MITDEQAMPRPGTADTDTVKAPPEQYACARLITVGTRVGILLMGVTQAIYMLGILPAHIAADQLPRYWGKDAGAFVQATHMPTGWHWLGMLGRSDILGLAGVALLASLTTVAYLAVLLPTYLKLRDIPYTLIAAAEVVVMLLAASGLLISGGH